MIRNITGVGQGPYIAIHDFGRTAEFAGFLAGADRMALDSHPYFAFSGMGNNAPIATGTGREAGGTWPRAACGWGDELDARCGVSFLCVHGADGAAASAGSA